MSQDPRLAVEGLAVSYGPITAVRGVSLEVRQGQIVAVVGANGAGKSSLLRAISGLEAAAAGTCRVDGRDITRMKAHARPALGLSHVPEGRRLFPRLSVRDNLVAGARSVEDETRRRRLAEVAELFPEIEGRLSQTAGSLSGGEQQMVAIARALMSDPSILMFDEPALGLAPIIVDRLADVFDSLVDAGKAILLAEQHVELALRSADIVHVMVLGTVRRVVAMDGTDPEDRDTARQEILDVLLGAS